MFAVVPRYSEHSTNTDISPPCMERESVKHAPKCPAQYPLRHKCLPLQSMLLTKPAQRLYVSVMGRSQRSYKIESVSPPSPKVKFPKGNLHGGNEFPSKSVSSAQFCEHVNMWVMRDEQAETRGGEIGRRSVLKKGSRQVRAFIKKERSQGEALSCIRTHHFAIILGALRYARTKEARYERDHH